MATVRTQEELLEIFADNKTGEISAGDVRDLVASMAIAGTPTTPTAHASSHATGGTDQITPSDIGAEATANKGQPSGYAGLDANGDLVGIFIPRLGTQAELNQVVLQQGEFAYCTDTKELRVGDGATAGGHFCNIVSSGTTTIGGGSLNFGAGNTFSALTYPARPFTSTGGSKTCYIDGGDFSAEFPRYKAMAMLSDDLEWVVSCTYTAYYDEVNNRTVVTSEDTNFAASGYVISCDVGSLASNYGLGNSITGCCSVVYGIGNTVSNYASIAVGIFCTASGIMSSAFGYATYATGDNSHAEGNTTSASGFASHAEGRSTTASGQNSHAEGTNTYAVGNSSHAEGETTRANASYTHAQGHYSVANKMCQSAMASAKFAADGDAQFTTLLMQTSTTNATEKEITINSNSATGTTETTSNRYICATGKTYTCTIRFAARSSTGVSAYFNRTAVISNTSGTVSLLNSTTVGTDYNPSGWNVAIYADNTNKSLKLTCTGAASTNIRWVAVVEAVEVGY